MSQSIPPSLPERRVMSGPSHGPIWAVGLGNFPWNTNEILACDIQETGIAVFLKLPRNLWWDRGTETFQEVMESHIMPSLESHYRIQPEPASRTFISREWSSKNALIYVFKHKSRFGNIALQSPLFGATFKERELITLMSQHPQLKFYLNWAQYDGVNPALPANIPKSTPQLARAL